MTDSACTRPCYQTNNHLPPIDKPIRKNIQLILFDMDGVLTDITSSWQYMHDHFNTTNEHSVQAYMKGEIDDYEFIRRDVGLWTEQGKPVTLQTVTDLLTTVPLMKGATKLCSYLQQKKIKTAIVSAGLDVLAQHIGKHLNIDYIYANGLQVNKQNRLTGEGILRVPLKHKEKTVQHICKHHNITAEHIASVGNSCFDIPLLESTGLGIAFNPSDDCIRQKADVVVEGRDLTDLIAVFNRYLH